MPIISRSASQSLPSSFSTLKAYNNNNDLGNNNSESISSIITNSNQSSINKKELTLKMAELM